MNWFIIASGILATVMVLGHIIPGRKEEFLPMVAAEFDPSPKRSMEFVWHMATATLILMAIALFAVGFGYPAEGGRILGWFVFAHYLIWGMLFLILMATSGMPNAVMKKWEWSLFLAVAATAGIGLSMG